MTRGGGIKGGDIFLRFVYPAKDGHVSITHVFGAAVGPSTRRFMEYLHEHGGCDEATRDKDWVTYAMSLSDGSESMEEFESIKEAIVAFTGKADQGQLVRRRPRPSPPARPGGHHHRRARRSAQFADRDYWDVHDGARYPGPYARLTGTPLLRPGPAPACGAHDGELDVLLGAPRPRPVPQPTDGTGRTSSRVHDLCPLAGLKVVDFMWAVAGPTLSCRLADAGATVVRIESSTKIDAARAFLPFFDNQVGVEHSALFNNLNAGKRSVTLNLSKPEARRSPSISPWADVVCESYSPRAMRASASTTSGCGRATPVW